MASEVLLNELRSIEEELKKNNKAPLLQMGGK